MGKVLRALKQSFEALLSLKIMALVLIPPLVSFLFFVVIFYIFWGSWITGLESFFSGTWLFQSMGRLFESIGPEQITVAATWMAVVILALVFIPLVILGAVFLTAVFVVPVALELITRQDFKHLEKKKGGSTLGSVWNASKAALVFLFLFIVTLPLWFIPGCQIAVPVILTAWLNKKVFVYDVLQDYATAKERKLIETQENPGLYGMGILLGLMAYIPLAFLIIPVISALCYIYYCLNELERLRSQAT